ncbi:MAG TPA: DMT family transporter [Aquificaceae bacterium]|nr:DMT family transporter [Aquificaceae bacterium]
MQYNHLLGVFFSLLSAVFWSTNDIFNKKLIQKEYDENFILWIRFPLGVVFLLPFGIYFWDMNSTVIYTTFLWLPLEILASIFFIRALKYSPLSLTMSFFATMPVFSASAGWVLLGEGLDFKGILGMFLIFYGSTILVGSDFKSFFTANKGAFYALLSSFLFGINVVIGKIAVIGSNQFFFSWYYCLVMSFALIPFVKKFPEFRKSIKEYEFIVVGVLFSLGMVFYTWAYIYTYASYVAAIERFAILLDVIYGRIFFGEKIRNALKASFIMILGALLLSL